MMSESQIVDKILRAIGKPVIFRYPERDPMIGILKDRAVVRITAVATRVPYWHVVDLIEFPNAQKKKTSWMIRIGYYRRSTKGRLVWASQTTITEPLSNWKRLLVNAAREKQWFRDLLKDVVEELE